MVTWCPPLQPGQRVLVEFEIVGTRGDALVQLAKGEHTIWLKVDHVESIRR